MHSRGGARKQVMKLSFLKHFETSAGAQSPVFIFAASSRTGSTLLQRVVLASSEVFIWGEPRFLGQAQKLHSRMIEISDLPGQTVSNLKSIPSGAWIPTIFPDKQRVRRALAGMFLDLYWDEPNAAGYKRWGFKEVRANAVKAAQFMHELFPDCRFLFLVRHPMDTYLSIRNKKFFKEFSGPYAPVDAWAENAAGFVDITARNTLPAILIRYEDLVGDMTKSGETVRKVCAHLRIKETPAMQREVQVKSGDSSFAYQLTAADRLEVMNRTRDVAGRLGYEF